jgi:hypothetical protein
VEESKRPCKNSSSCSPAGPSVHTQLTSPRRITRSALTSIASISALAATSHFKYLLALSHSAALTAHHQQHHLATSSLGVHWPSMSSAAWHAAVAAVLTIILCSRLAEARVHPSHGGGLATRRRDVVPAGVGGCALAVEPLGYPCEEHEVRPPWSPSTLFLT